MPQLGSRAGMPAPIDTRALIERSRGTSMQEITNSGMYGKVKGVSGVSALATGESVQSMKSASGRFEIDIPNELLLVGSATAPLTGVGIFLGLDDPDYEFRVGNPAANYLHWNGTTLTIVGSITATTGTIGGWSIGSTALTSGSGANTVGLDSGGTNPAIYAGSATPASAPFRVTQAGALVATSATITGTIVAGSVVATNSFTGTAPVFDGSVTVQAAQGATRHIIGHSSGNATHYMYDTNNAEGGYFQTTPTLFHLRSTSRNLQLEANGAGNGIALVVGAGGNVSVADLVVSTTLLPSTNNAVPLGSGSFGWSDLFLGSGAVINFNNGDVTLTHSAGLLTASDPIAVPYLEVGTTAALGGGAAPTLGTIGGSGPATAAQNQWLKFTVTGSGTFWVPVWA